MKCEDCKYHSFVAGTHFCDSRNHKQRTVRITEEDSKRDIDCKWADEKKVKRSYGRNAATRALQGRK